MPKHDPIENLLEDIYHEGDQINEIIDIDRVITLGKGMSEDQAVAALTYLDQLIWGCERAQELVLPQIVSEKAEKTPA